MRELARLCEARRWADDKGRERIAAAPRLFLQAEAAARETALAFLDRAENIVFIGPTGLGKRVSLAPSLRHSSDAT